MPEHSEFTVTVRNGDQVIQTITIYAAASNLSVDIIRKPELPTRSPLHPDALIFDDMVPGLIVRRIDSFGHTYPRDGIIVGSPIQARITGISFFDVTPDTWVVLVGTSESGGKLVNEYWSLSEMGVAPYFQADGTFLLWNTQNYTLAVG